MHLHRDQERIVITVPAKVNLFLEILARRPDRFHELETLMVTVSLFDTLVFTAQSSGPLTFTCRWAAGLEAWGNGLRRREPTTDLFGPLPTTEDNLAFRALRLLRERAGVNQSASVNLIKRIPAAAGLGGASADAAAALWAANVGWKLGWSVDRLAELAAELGSDIPFFLRSSTAVCRGRGEQIEPVSRLRSQPVVIIRPPEGLSTPAVYQRCRPADQPQQAEGLLHKLRLGDRRELQRLFVNGLETPAREISPWVIRVQQRMDREGWVAHQMSGSGTSCFGLARSARQARRLEGRWRTSALGVVMQASFPSH